MAVETPISLQLYTLRDSLPNDLEGVLGKVAETGYVGVEPWGGLDFEKAAPLIKSLGMEAHSMHAALPVGDDKAKVMEMANAYGVKWIVCPFLPPEGFATRDAVKAKAEKLNEANEEAVSSGYIFGYHNHSHEFQDIEGQPALTVLKEYLDPQVSLQIDTYWVQVGGTDPVAYVKAQGDRSPLLHIKDGPATREDDMVALGTGVIDIPALVEAGQGYTKWLIVELDRCATDMMEAVVQSYAYMIGEGLARGRSS